MRTHSLFAPRLASARAFPLFTAVTVGLLAGVCEELFYRGPLQTALARRLPVGLTLLVGGFLFAAAHLDAHGMLFRTLLGMLLGWIVLRGGSLFPAIVLHTVADAAHFGVLAWGLRAYGGDGTDPAAAMNRFQAAFADSWPFWLAAGAALACFGLWLCLSAYRRRAQKQEALLEPQPQAGSL